jgi:hypothetical protein
MHCASATHAASIAAKRDLKPFTVDLDMVSSVVLENDTTK